MSTRTRPRVPARFSRPLIAGAALAVAVAAGTAYAVGGGSGGCEAAIRAVVAKAAAGTDMSASGKPRACRGLSDAETTRLGEKIMGEQMAGILGTAFTDAFTTPTAPDAAAAPPTPTGALTRSQACRADLVTQLATSTGAGDYTIERRPACDGVPEAKMQAMAREIIRANG